MDIVVHHRPGFKKTMLEMLANFYCRHLGIDKSKRTLVVTTSRGQAQQINAPGVTGTPELGSKVLIVSLDASLSVHDTVYTMAHEMVHVAQRVRGILTYRQVQGKTVPFWRGKRSDHLSYLQQPWERQAMAETEFMARSFEEATFGAYKS